MVDYLKAAKNIISGKSPFAESPIASDNRKDRIDQCKVVIYQWVNELGTDPSKTFGFGSPVPLSAPASELSKARAYDISNHIEGYAFTKAMGGASGTFQIVLQNSFDWSRFVKPGQWITVYLAGDGSLPMPAEKPVAFNPASSFGAAGQLISGSLGSFSSLFAGASGLETTAELPLPAGPTEEQLKTMRSKRRCLGIVQRVGVRSQTTVDGVQEITYVITGKDFGTVYEETELWFNANNADATAFTKAVSSISRTFARNLTELLTRYHSIFLSPEDDLVKQLTTVKAFFPEQWVMPDQLIKDLGVTTKSGNPHFGDINGLTEFNATVFENPMEDPFAGLQGRCWEKLKSISQPEYHELFTELSDEGEPRVIFRPIPWSMDKSRYPVTGKVMLSYKDLTNPEGVPAPLPTGINVGSKFSSFEALKTAVKDFAGNSASVRTQHRIPLTAVEVEGFDVGPDYHSRANFFLVDAMTAMKDQNTAWALMRDTPLTPFPFRDENDVKRHGFRPLFVNIHSFLVSNAQLFGSSAQKDFMLEANEILRDFYANAEDFYSGSINIAAGKNSVKLGKVFVTDASFPAIDNMVFYIEGYTDNFNINIDGVGMWTQTVSVTRGMDIEVLTGKSPKDKHPTKTGTFHVQPKGDSSPTGMLDKAKKAIKDPTSLF